ncbi:MULTISPECIES: hypothetical protein [unclassified Nocardioides]|uniref:hypothetical protein n=1 Tax=unclassified Nocardioides TaxID=2615069 RepID=UPI001153BEF0|nr:MULTISPECIES: hypothetical protein [unclassified Nocardioides]WGY00174.1 hypothetical protein QI633_16705 [Nocardioides sp. QY071]
MTKTGAHQSKLRAAIKGRSRHIVALTSAAVVLAGCSTDDAARDPAVASSTADQSSKVDLSILAAGGSIDAESFPSPQALLKVPGITIAVTGTIDGIEDGPTVLESESGLGYPDIREKFALVRVKVGHTYRRPPSTGDQEYVYVALSRGIEVIDQKGQSTRKAGAPSTITGLDAFAKALPAATRVVVMGERWAAPPGPLVRVEPAPGIAEDAIVVRGTLPQAISFETTPGGEMSSWRGYTFGKLAAEAETAAKG